MHPGSLLLFVWMFIMFIIPTVLANQLLSTHIYGFNSFFYTYVRVSILSLGGWVFNREEHLYLAENTTDLWANIPNGHALFFATLFLSQIVSMTVVGVYVSTV